MTANLDDSDELTVSNGRTANVIMARLRRAIESGVYADGGCIDSTREIPRKVLPWNCEVVLPQAA